MGQGGLVSQGRPIGTSRFSLDEVHREWPQAADLKDRRAPRRYPVSDRRRNNDIRARPESSGLRRVDFVASPKQYDASQYSKTLSIWMPVQRYCVRVG